MTVYYILPDPLLLNPEEITKVRGKLFQCVSVTIRRCIESSRKEYINLPEAIIIYTFYILREDFVEENITKIYDLLIRNPDPDDLSEFLLINSRERKEQVYKVDVEIARSLYDPNEIFIIPTISDGYHKLNVGGIETLEICTLDMFFSSIPQSKLVGIITLEDIGDMDILSLRITSPKLELSSIVYEIGKEKLNILSINKLSDLYRFDTLEEVLRIIAPEAVPIERW